MPSHTRNRDDLAVAFDHNPMSVISLAARLLKARDPYGALPPANVDLSTIAETSVTARAVADLSAALAIIEDTRKIDANKLQEAAGQGMQAFMDWALWLGAGRAFTFQKGLMLRQAVTKPPLRGATLFSPRMNRVTKALSALCEAEDTQSADWPDGTLADDLVFLTLWMSFWKVQEDDYYVGPIDVPMGNSKERFAMLTRTRRLSGLVATLKTSVSVAKLLEFSTLIQSPALAHLFTNPGATATAATGFALPLSIKEYLADLHTKLSAIKIHPWIAAAMSVGVPRRAYTPWSEGSWAMGLCREGHFAFLREAAILRGKREDVTDFRDVMLDYIQSNFIPAADGVLTLRNMLHEEDVRRAESLFGLVGIPGPQDVFLHGEKFKPLLMTSESASEPINSLAQLATTMALPLAETSDAGTTSVTDALVGTAAVLEIIPATWTDETVARAQGAAMTIPFIKPDNVPALYVEPERIVDSLGFTLNQLSPAMVQPVKNGYYFGEQDAVMRAYTIKDIAKMLSYPDVAAMVANPFAMQQLESLFEKNDQGDYIPKIPNATQLFYSRRTRQPWRERVFLPTAGLPTRLVAFSADTTPMGRDIKALAVRDDYFPSLDAGVEASVAELANSVVTTLGGRQ